VIVWKVLAITSVAYAVLTLRAQIMHEACNTHCFGSVQLGRDAAPQLIASAILLVVV